MWVDIFVVLGLPWLSDVADVRNHSMFAGWLPGKLQIPRAQHVDRRYTNTVVRLTSDERKYL